MTIGIYAVINEELGIVAYIGCSSNILARKRWITTPLRRNEFVGHLQNSFNLLGLRAIGWEILEETTLDNLRERERFWINLYLPELNIQHTPKEESIRASQAEKLRGRKMTEDHRLKIAESLKGNRRTLGFKHSDKTREKMRKSRILYHERNLLK